MPTTLGINGLSCIGRFALRAAIANLKVEVKAVGVPFMDPKFMVYQVKYQVHKGFPGTIACQPPSPGFRVATANPEIEVKAVNGFMDRVLGLLGEVRQCGIGLPGTITMPTTFCAEPASHRPR